MQTCLITGGGRGIGKEIALKLASEDRHIIITGRKAEALESVCSIVKKKGGECEFILSDFAAISGMEFLLQRLKPMTIDILVNNAAVAHVEPLENISLEKWGNFIRKPSRLKLPSGSLPFVEPNSWQKLSNTLTQSS